MAHRNERLSTVLSTGGSSDRGDSRSARPNPSLSRTRYDTHRKPGPRHMVHHRVRGKRRLTAQAG